MGRIATHQVWAISFITLPQLSPEVPFSQRQEDQGRGANTHPMRFLCVRTLGWYRDTAGMTNTLFLRWRRLTASHLTSSKCWEEVFNWRVLFPLR